MVLLDKYLFLCYIKITLYIDRWLYEKENFNHPFIVFDDNVFY